MPLLKRKTLAAARARLRATLPLGSVRRARSRVPRGRIIASGLGKGTELATIAGRSPSWSAPAAAEGRYENICSCRTSATILHADVDAFFAAVEQRDDPHLRGRPVIVGAGVVLAGELRGEGARRPHRDGRRRGPAGSAPSAIVVAPRMSAYSEASKAVYRVFDDTTPLVEGLSIDEAFLDVRGLQAALGHARWRSPARLRRDVRERVGLPITVGVARTKFLAKVASGVAKPDGLLARAARPRARVPAPAAGRAALGRRPGDRERSSTTRGSRRSARSPSSPRHALVCAARPRRRAAPARARAQPRPAAGRARRAARARSGRSVRSGRRPRSLAEVDAVARRARRPRRPADARRRPRRPHRRPAAALRRLLARQPARTRCRYATANTRTILVDRAGLARDRCAADRAPRDHARRGLGRQPRRRARRPAQCCRSTGTAATRSTRRSTRCGCASGSAAITRAVLLGRCPELTMPLLPD